jgi:hypothetical protein
MNRLPRHPVEPGNLGDVPPILDDRDDGGVPLLDDVALFSRGRSPVAARPAAPERIRAGGPA